MMRAIIVAASLSLVAHTAIAQAKTSSGTHAQSAKSAAASVERPGGKLAVPAADTSGPPPTIMRELYVYAADGRRDPFVSLLTTGELRPTISDLRVTGIIVDQSPARRSVATLRDLVTNAQYRIVLGSKLGRMTVTAIRPKVILFTIDEFGTTRQDSLVMGDTTKVRGK
jgi:hypothetical protein